MARSIRWSAIVQKARKDADFKKALLENPRKALEEISGIKLPEGVTYVVHEQTPTEVHLVLPLDPGYDRKSMAVFTEGDDSQAVFTEGDDAAVFTEDDDADKAVFTEGDDT